MRRYMTFAAAALLSSVAIPALANADARVTADLNMRAGPSTDFPVVAVLPDGALVDVYGCIRGYTWCDVSWSGYRGWASAGYLRQAYQGNYVPMLEYGPTFDLPIVSFSFGSYWDDYYRDKPWYGRRDRWRSVWRDNDRRERRAERREDRREEIRERRQDRRSERFQERRQELRERRSDRRQQLRERRQNRREAVRERRQDRRAERRENRAERRQDVRERAASAAMTVADAAVSAAADNRVRF
ncbi:MAG: SH3 domain-containing protein [Rhodomicrobium sp.]|nr:SH3 domain-containing protein [Rhodomicrobium sp.]